MSDESKNTGTFTPIEEPPGSRPLSRVIQERYAQNVVIHGNKTRALREAGSTASLEHQTDIAHRMHKRPHVQARVQYLIKQLCPSFEFDVAKGIAYVAHAAQDPRTPLKERIAAIKLLTSLIDTKEKGKPEKPALPAGLVALPEED